MIITIKGKIERGISEDHIMILGSSIFYLHKGDYIPSTYGGDYLKGGDILST